MIPTILHLVLAVLRVFRQKQAWVRILELRVVRQILDGGRISSSMLVHILHCNHVTVRKLAFLHT